jgi:4'-phosphopantetheinyl transferase EntD
VSQSSSSARELQTAAGGEQTISPFTSSSVSFSLCSGADLVGFELHPLEAAALGDAVSDKRKRDFRLGRAAARQAVLKTGFPVTTPILRGEHREPLWPVGITGSIAHCSDYGIAAAAWQQDVPAIGVDIQLIEERYTEELIARFADPDEFDWVRSDPSLRTERAVKLFSAKESVFKALYPLRRVWFAFDVAHLTPVDGERAFRADVRLPTLSSRIIKLDVGISYYNHHIITGALLSEPLSYTLRE